MQKQQQDSRAMLNYPAENSISSVLHGMSDAIKNTPYNIIAQHLSLIIPFVSKCFVDEDRGVRKLQLRCYSKILLLDLFRAIYMGGSMRSFLQLILAYICSALHSLDQDVRYDGCVALEALCMGVEGGRMGSSKRYTAVNV